MKDLEKEIMDVEESIQQLEDAFWQEKIKYGMPSNARREEHNREIDRLKNYLKGLEVAKVFIEKGASNNGENKYCYTIVEDGEIKYVDRVETEEEMHNRVKCYRQNNIKVKKVVKECSTTMWIDVQF